MTPEEREPSSNSPAQDPARTCLIVTAGSDVIGESSVSPFVLAQANSLRHRGWVIEWGLVDDRTSIGGLWRNLTRRRDSVRRIQPMVVHARYGAVIAALAAAVRGKAAFVVTFCGDDLLGTPGGGLRRRARATVARLMSVWSAWRADRIITVSEQLRLSLPAPLQHKADVVPNGVDLNLFQPCPREWARRQLGWPQDAFTVLFNASSGDNRAVKNEALARAAIARLDAGSGKTAFITISDRPQVEVVSMLNAADVLLVTSLHEGSPNIVKEAMACNLPVVSVSCGDVRTRLEGVSPGSICGYDAEELAAALGRLRAVTTRSNGRDALIRQGLSAERVAARIEQVYLAAGERRTS